VEIRLRGEWGLGVGGAGGAGVGNGSSCGENLFFNGGLGCSELLSTDSFESEN